MTQRQTSTSEKWALAGHIFAVVGTTCISISGLLKLLKDGRLPSEPMPAPSRGRHLQELTAADYFDRDRRHP